MSVPGSGPYLVVATNERKHKETSKEKDLMLLSFHELISIGQRVISSSLM